MPDQIAADPISDYNGLAVPPLDDSFFSDDINNSLLFFNDHDDDVFNFDFTFDDVVNLPSDNFADPDSIPVHFPSDPDDSGSITESHELTQLSDDPNFNVAGYFNVDGENSSENVPKVSDCRSVEIVRVCDDASQVNVSSSDSRDWSNESENKNLNVCGDSNSAKVEARKPECSGPTSSQGSDNCERSVGSSMKLDKNLANNVVDWKFKVEELGNNSQLLKRKKEEQDVISESTRTIKYRRSANAVGAGVTTDESNVFSEMNDDDEKRKTRLMRNRESAQLSRQRKKHYVEDLEDKPPAAPYVMMQSPPPQSSPTKAAHASTSPTASPKALPAPPTAAPKSSLPPLKCPMAGTFYRCPSPGAPPFVKVRSQGPERSGNMHH